MSTLLYCSTCCMVLSLWAVAQLAIMGFCYHIEAVTLVEDAHAHKPDHKNNYDEFIKLTKDNYAKTAINCWVVAGIYAVTLVLSCCGLQKANRDIKKAELLDSDVEYTCRKQKESQLGKMEDKVSQ